MIELKLILATLLIAEGITLIARFGFRKQSRNVHVSRMKKKWKKRGFHWHHLFLGLLIIPVSLIFSGGFEKCLFNLGIGIFLSDIVHHFIFLALITGSSEFCLFYKNKDFSEEKAERRIMSKIIKTV